jgi:hypothetical protein
VKLPFIFSLLLVGCTNTKLVEPIDPLPDDVVEIRICFVNHDICVSDCMKSTAPVISCIQNCDGVERSCWSKTK